MIKYCAAENYVSEILTYVGAPSSCLRVCVYEGITSARAVARIVLMLASNSSSLPKLTARCISTRTLYGPKANPRFS